MKPRERNPVARGFTLVEVMVALAVVAIALGALIKAGADVSTNTVYLRDKTFAHWVALNLVAEQRLRAEWPAVGSRNGVTEFAGRQWRWEQVVETTGDGDIRRLLVGVERPETRGTVASLVAYLPRPDRATR